MRRIFAVMIGVVLLGIQSGIALAVTYTYSHIDHPQPGEARDINNDGTIVGNYDGDANKILGFSLNGTTLTTLEYPQADWTLPYGINNTGTIAGTKLSTIAIGFTYDGTDYTLVEPIATEMWVYGINDAGTVVGMALGWASPNYDSFSQSGATRTLLSYPDGLFYARGVNNAGVVVGECYDGNGTHACMLSGSTWTLLDYPGASSTIAWDINNVGVIVGEYTDAGGNVHGFSFDGFTWTALDYPGAALTIAYGINDQGKVVGHYEGSDGSVGSYLATPDFLSVGIDIRPWSAWNVISRWDRGLLPVAILSAGWFDALDAMDLGTITFGRTGDEHSMAFCSPWEWDVNRDGYKDLICFFWTHRAGFLCGDTSGVLRGTTQDGIPLEGKSPVKVVPCR